MPSGEGALGDLSRGLQGRAVHAARQGVERRPSLPGAQDPLGQQLLRRRVRARSALEPRRGYGRARQPDERRGRPGGPALQHPLWLPEEDRSASEFTIGLRPRSMLTDQESMYGSSRFGACGAAILMTTERRVCIGSWWPQIDAAARLAVHRGRELAVAVVVRPWRQRRVQPLERRDSACRRA